QSDVTASASAAGVARGFGMPFNRARRFPRTTSKGIGSWAARSSWWFRPALERLEDRTVPSFAIRATEFDAGGNMVRAGTQTSPASPGNPFTATFSLPDFSITIVTNNSTTGSGSSSHSSTINMLYIGPAGAASDRLLVEVLGDSYANPAGPAAITSNGSPS